MVTFSKSFESSILTALHFVVSMVFHPTYQYVSQRAYPLTSQTENNFMNTSLIIRIPEQPITSVAIFYICREQRIHFS